METQKDFAIRPVATARPIEYLGGVLNEETRHLLESYIKNLDDGEAVLVIYRVAEHANSDVLLESTIQQITNGRDWDFVPGGRNNHDMQLLVDNLAHTVKELRVTNKIFAQGNAKVTGFDQHKINFGIIGNGKMPVTYIKGIVHHQLNIELNGDLLLHEEDIIIHALSQHGVFHERLDDGPPKARPIVVKTYGAGRSTSIEVNTAHLQVSDGVIDIRTHIDPSCIIEHLMQYITTHPQPNTSHNRSQLEEFQKQVVIIKVKMYSNEALGENIQLVSNKDYTGIEMVHDIAELARRAASYTRQSTVDMMKEMRDEDKRYYGEISFSSMYRGVNIIHRIDRDEHGKPFLGHTGQKQALIEIQTFMRNMAKEYDLQPLLDNINDIQAKIEAKEKQIDDFLFKKLSESHPKEDELKNQVKMLHKEITMVSKRLNGNEPLNKTDLKELEDQYLTLLNQVEIKESRLHGLFEEIKKSLIGTDKETYDLLELNLTTLIHDESVIQAKLKNLQELIDTDRSLRKHIEIDKKSYARRFLNHEFGVRVSGNLFFTGQGKAAVDKYGAKTVGMENGLFVLILFSSIANRLHASSHHITLQKLLPILFFTEHRV